MNYIDIGIAIPLIWGAYKGFTKGLIIELASIVALVLGVYVGMNFSEITINYLKEWLEISTTITPLVAFAITFVLVIVGVMVLAKIIEQIINLVALKLINKLAGAFFGLLKWGMIVSLLVVFVDSFDARFEVIPKDTKNTSLLYNGIKEIAPTIIPAIKDINIDAAIQQGKAITIPSI